jgi:hypothetical protein
MGQTKKFRNTRPNKLLAVSVPTVIEQRHH